MNQNHLARQTAKQESPKVALEALFNKPPKSKGMSMATKLDELQQKIESLQKERDDLLAKEKQSAVETINAMIKSFGLQVKDLNFNGYTKATTTRAKVAMKYKSGMNAWSGRGRKPRWIEEHLKKGGKLEDILIKP